MNGAEQNVNRVKKEKKYISLHEEEYIRQNTTQTAFKALANCILLLNWLEGEVFHTINCFLVHNLLKQMGNNLSV